MHRHSVLILGYGEMGHALETLLAPHHDVTIWNRSPLAGRTFEPLETLVPQAEVLFFCLPVNAHDAMLTTLKPLLNPATLCISIAKGLNAQGQTAAELFRAHEIAHFALLYGPMLSEELCVHKAGFAQFGCADVQDVALFKSLFAKTPLFLSPTHDLTGISWSVIIKNVYALAFGMIDALDMGRNVRGFLTVLALSELDAIAHAMGGAHRSSYGLAGLGDLITTGTSTDSHHHELGRKMARGDYTNIRGEGINTLQKVKTFGRFDWKQFPLFCAIDTVVEQKIDAKSALERLFDHVQH